jgi:cathepsin D
VPQIKGSVTQIFDNVIPNSASGLMGLGFQQLARTGANPFWQQILNNGQLSSQEFSFQLARDQGGSSIISNTNAGGQFILGGRNSTLFQGDVEFQNMPRGAQQGFWLQDVAGTLFSPSISLYIELILKKYDAELNINGHSTTINSRLAAIDTGTTLLGGPDDSVSDFYAQIQGSQRIQNGMFSFRT